MNALSWLFWNIPLLLMCLGFWVAVVIFLPSIVLNVIDRLALKRMLKEVGNALRR